MPFEVGYILNNRYRIVKLLGQGGFGAVYKAWDLNLSYTCAVKENLDISAESQRQFLREATVLARLSHPNLPRVTDHFIIPEQGQYLVMDFIEGDDLQTMIEKSEIVPAEQVKRWILQVMDALIYLHSRVPPVLHRDIKPANIRVTPEDKAYLVDFGLVKQVESTLKTAVGARAITAGYSPPEQYGSGNTNARSDIYSLGATMYTLLTGLQPPESIQRATGETLRPVNVVNPAVPASLSNLVMRAMAVNPMDRFSDVMQMKGALQMASTALSAAPSTVAVPPPFPATASAYPTPISQPQAYPQQPAYSPETPQYPQSEPLPAYPNYASSYPPPTSAPAKKKPIALIVIGALVGLGLLAALCVGGLYLLGKSDPTPTAAIVQITATPASIQQPTTEVIVMPTKPAATLAIATQAVEATAAAPVDLPEELVSIFSAPTGAIPHDPADGNIAIFITDVDVADFVAKAEVTNPFGANEGNWDLGFLFREEGFNKQYRLSILSNRSWELTNHTGESAGTVITSGTANSLRVNANESNTIMLVAYQDQGWFFLNDGLVAAFPLTDRLTGGNIELATGLFKDNEQAGATTAFKNFEVWELHVNENSGTMAHDDDTYIEEYGSDALYKNFIVKAVFTNPYKPDVSIFSSGFLFRTTDVNSQYRASASGNNTWEITYNSGTADGVVIASGDSDLINIEDQQENALELIAYNNNGWFFVNEVEISQFDLSDHQEPGDLHVATGFFSGDEVPGHQTNFSGFVILPLP